MTVSHAGGAPVEWKQRFSHGGQAGRAAQGAGPVRADCTQLAGVADRLFTPKARRGEGIC